MIREERSINAPPNNKEIVFNTVDVPKTVYQKVSLFSRKYVGQVVQVIEEKSMEQGE